MKLKLCVFYGIGYHVHAVHTHTYCSDIIDVTYIEPHSMETAEVKGRTRDY